MPSQPFRFLHAANLRLGSPLLGCGPVPAKLQTVCEDASLVAFDTVVDAALSQQVEFLLLTGRCLNDSSPSLRGAVTLVHGLERLAEQGIAAFLAPSDLDPNSDWWPGGPLPDSVTWLTTSSEPVEIESETEVFATIQWVSPEGADPNRHGRSRKMPLSAPHPGKPGSGHAPFSIGICRNAPHSLRKPLNNFLEHSEPLRSTGQPGDDSTARDETPISPDWEQALIRYAALDEGPERETRQVGNTLFHNPGAPQGLSASETGPHGCTLVDVDASARVTATFLPVGPLRWERQKVAIGTALTRTALLDLLSSAAQGTPPHPHEQVRLMKWEFQGRGPLWLSLQDAEFRAALCDELQRTAGLTGVTLWNHSMRLLDSRKTGDEVSPSDRLTSEYLEHFAKLQPRRSEMLTNCLQTSTLDRTPWGERLHALLPNLDYDAILETARRWGISRFAEQAEES